MKENIIANINNPKELEELYRLDKSAFKREFNSLYPEFIDNKLAGFWNERLNHKNNSDISWGTKGELTWIIIASLLAGFIAKIPDFFQVSKDFFYLRDAGFVMFPVLIFYFALKNNLSVKKNLMIAAAILISLIFINLLPINETSDTLKLSCFHLPFLLWSILGFAFVGGRLNNCTIRIGYLRYNGDLIIITTIILISGAILTAISIALFSLINSGVDDFYKNYVVIFGLAASTIVGTYIVQKNPQLVNKVSPVIAKIFSPLVLITLVIFLIAIIVTGKDPYSDREFLLKFNGLLIIVMAIIIFSVAETSRSKHDRAGIVILFLLSVVTIIVNCIALSAILFRISEWGFTPNRLAVLGGNVLILTNLFIVCYKLFRIMINKSGLEEVENAVAVFLPVYSVWSVVVIFIFPFLFDFR